MAVHRPAHIIGAPKFVHDGVVRQTPKLNTALLRYDPKIRSKREFTPAERLDVLRRVAYLQEVLWCTQGLPWITGAMFAVAYKKEGVELVYGAVAADIDTVETGLAEGGLKFFQGILARITIARLVIAYSALGYRAEGLREVGNVARAKRKLPPVPPELFNAICSSKEGATSKLKELYEILSRWFESLRQRTPPKYLKDQRG